MVYIVSEFQTSQGYIGRPCLFKIKKRITICKPGVVLNTCNPSTLKVGKGGLGIKIVRATGDQVSNSNNNFNNKKLK